VHRNRLWKKLWRTVANNGGRAKLLLEHPGNQYLLQHIDRVLRMRRNPRVVEDAIAELWTNAGRRGIEPGQELVRWAGGEPLPRVTDQNPAHFREVLRADKPHVDLPFADSPHGRYTHMFDEYILARPEVLGSRDAARRSRQAIANAEGPASEDGEEFYSLVWNALFDETDGGQLNTPEEVGSTCRSCSGS